MLQYPFLVVRPEHDEGGGEGGSGSDDSSIPTSDDSLGAGDGDEAGSDDSAGVDKSVFKMLTFSAFCSLCSRFLNFVSERRT